MNHQKIKIFLCVAECRNFSLAAEQLYLSQSVVSYHVGMLEKEIGFALFTRNTHSVELTLAGMVFYKSMAELMAQYETALAEARKVALGNPRQLRICFGTPTSPTMMGQIVNQIDHILSYGEITLSKRNYENDVLQPLVDGLADILFTYPPFYRKKLGLQQKAFCKTWTSCMMCPQHPLSSREALTLADLNGQTLLFVDSRNAHTEYRDIYHRIRLRTKNGPRLESTPKSFEQAQGFAMAGRGVMLVQTLDHLHHANIDGLVSIPLLDVEPVPLIAVWRGEDLCPLGRKLLERIPDIVSAE